MKPLLDPLKLNKLEFRLKNTTCGAYEKALDRMGVQDNEVSDGEDTDLEYDEDQLR